MRAAGLCLILLTTAVVSLAQVPEALTEGGLTGPDGTPAVCQMPVELRMRNAGGMGPRGPGTGSGLCVFTSIEHAGRYQNVPQLWGFQRKMTYEKGGGWPAKVDAMIAKHAKGTRYIQHTGGDLELLWRAMQTGRMPGVTYAGMDMHYGQQHIAHMVNLIHLDPPTKSPRLAAVLDNNFPGERQIVWMTAEEFGQRWRDMDGGWAIVLLNPPPPPKAQP